MEEPGRAARSRPGPRGIGGWLIPVAIGLCVLPLRLLADLASNLLPAFKAQTWQALTTPTSREYDPLWAPLLIGELVVSLALLALSVITILLFFGKKRRAPSMIITVFALGIGLQIADLSATQAIPAAAKITRGDLLRLLQSVTTAAIWVPYFICSRRVRATFVE